MHKIYTKHPSNQVIGKPIILEKNKNNMKSQATIIYKKLWHHKIRWCCISIWLYILQNLRSCQTIVFSTEMPVRKKCKCQFQYLKSAQYVYTVVPARILHIITSCKHNRAVNRTNISVFTIDVLISRSILYNVSAEFDL